METRAIKTKNPKKWKTDGVAKKTGSISEILGLDASWKRDAETVLMSREAVSSRCLTSSLPFLPYLHLRVCALKPFFLNFLNSSFELTNLDGRLLTLLSQFSHLAIWPGGSTIEKFVSTLHVEPLSPGYFLLPFYLSPGPFSV